VLSHRLVLVQVGAQVKLRQTSSMAEFMTVTGGSSQSFSVKAQAYEPAGASGTSYYARTGRFLVAYMPQATRV